MSRNLSALTAILFLTFAGAAFALDDGDDNDYQIPEGFEERRYSLQTLLRAPTDFQFGSTSFPVSQVPALTGQNVVEILRTCVAPDSWTKRGNARMELTEPVLIVLQKKEVHAEIEKVLQWLNDGVSPSFRATVVAVSLKTATARKLAASSTVTPADFAKALEEAGETGVDVVELRGVERQAVAATSAFQQNFIKDYDVSGALQDPVIATTGTGFSANAVVYRNPDCASLQIDLSVKILDKIEMAKAKLLSDGGIGGLAPTEIKTTVKDNNGKDKDERQTIPHEGKPVAIHSDLTIELPSQNGGGLQTSLNVPQGAFVPAGIIDLSAPNQTPGMLTVVFVRASAGATTIPSLIGVSGLKEGEIFRLYPAAANLRHAPSFPGNLPDVFTRYLELGTAAPLDTANPFMAAPAPEAAAVMEMRGLKDSIAKSQKLFSEKVRKNKIVEAMGPIVFTRLVEADHARFLGNLVAESRFYSTPVSVHAVALALPPAVYRKLLLDDHAAFEAAEVEALGGNGAQLLAEAAVRMMPGGNFANVFAGRKRSIVSDYEISGDSYDPVIRQLPENAFAMDFVCRRGAQPNGDEVEVRFNSVPGKLIVDRETLDTFAYASGPISVLLNLRADLDKTKHGAIGIRSAARGAGGKYALAGSAQMPNLPDGKRDPRQAVLFVRLTDEK